MKTTVDVVNLLIYDGVWYSLANLYPIEYLMKEISIAMIMRGGILMCDMFAVEHLIQFYVHEYPEMHIHCNYNVCRDEVTVSIKHDNSYNVCAAIVYGVDAVNKIHFLILDYLAGLEKGVKRE